MLATGTRKKKLAPVEAEKKKKLRSKQRRTAKLLKLNPQRDSKPSMLVDKQVKSAHEFLEKDNLSRGQRKRLQKKEKFINSAMLATKGKKL